MARKCVRCARCCLQGPCIIDATLRKAVSRHFKFIKDEVYFGKYRPLMNSKGVCRYLRKDAGTYSCPVIEKVDEFRKHMDSGVCAFRY